MRRGTDRHTDDRGQYTFRLGYASREMSTEKFAELFCLHKLLALDIAAYLIVCSTAVLHVIVLFLLWSALCNRADHYIFILFLLSFFFFFLA